MSERVIEVCEQHPCEDEIGSTVLIGSWYRWLKDRCPWCRAEKAERERDEARKALREVAECLPLTPMTALKVIKRVLREDAACAAGGGEE